MSARRRLAGLSLPVALAACRVGPNYQAPPLVRGATPAPALLGTQEPAFSAAPLPDGWWRLYDDPVLDALVRKALTRNTDLRTALASLQQAQAELRVARAQRTPATQFTGGAVYAQASADALAQPSALPAGPFFDLGEGISYDIDLFGRLRRGVEEARASAEAAQAALDLARVNVAAQTAGGYSTVCAAGLRIRVTERSLKVAQGMLRLIERRFQAGVSSSTDVVRSRTLVRQTEAELPPLYAQQRSGLYLLATLTGDPPERFPPGVAACASPPLIRRPIPVGDGSGLIARRPDVREAERMLHARVAAIGVATAALYPSVTLAGSIGTQAASVADIASTRGFAWSVGPMVSWSFPNTRIVRAEIAASDAAARGALAQFDGSVLTALRESETAMSTLARQLDAERALGLARDDAETASADTSRLYAGGVGEFIDTLDAERTAIAADDALAQATATVSQDQVTLFMALGGGWQGAPPVEDVSLQQVTAPPKPPRRR